MTLRNLFFLIAFCTSIYSWGESLLSVSHYSIQEGLSQNTVQSIIQDNEGYIWLATWNGLEKFDGYRFKNYKSYPTDSIRLSYNRITHIEKGYGAHIWCQTFGGKTYLFNSHTERFENPLAEPVDFTTDESSQIYPLKTGITWIINPSGTIYRIDEKQLPDQAAVQIYEHHIPDKNDIYTIAADSWGNEWILTRRGVRLYNRPFQSQEIFKHILEIDSTVFLSTIDGRLFSYRPVNGLKEIALPVSVNRIDGLYESQDHRLCIATPKQLLFCKDDNDFSIVFPPGNETWRINKFYQSHDGVLWILDGQDKIWRIDLTENTPRLISYVQGSKKRNGFILEDAFGGIWIQPYYGLFSYYDPQDKVLKPARQTQGDQEADYHAPGLGYHIDKHRNLWLCCKSGFDQLTFSPRNYTLLRQERAGQYEIPNTIRGLFIDSQKRLWCASKQGVIELYDSSDRYIGNLSRSGKIVNNPQTAFGASAYTFFEDSLHRMWIGCKEDGLFIATPEKTGNYRIRRYRHNAKDPYSLSENSIYDICSDKQGRIWIGTYGGGLNLVENPSAHPLRFIHKGNRLNSFPQEAFKVRNICTTVDGVILAATTGGLLSFDDDLGTPEDIVFHLNRSRQNQASSLSNNDVMYIYRRKNGDLYIVPYSGGISRIASENLLSDSIEFVHFNKRNGLPSDLAYAITESNDSSLWITFQNSICRYDTETETAETYDRFDRQSHLAISEVPPVTDSRNGLYVGTENGLLRLDLNRLRKSDIVPPIVFTQVHIPGGDGKEEIKIITGDTLLLQPQERNISLSFAALDYTDPKAIRYAYRIKEMNDSWNNLHDNRTVSFADLPAGKWSLEIRSTNGDGIWTDNTRVLHLIVTPTFGETPWAIFLYILAAILVALLALGIFLYIANLRRSVSIEQQVTQLKLKFFTDISHELRTPLTLIASPLEAVLQKESLAPDVRKNLIIAQHNTHRMLRLINQILDFRKIQNGKMKLFIACIDVKELSRHTFESFEHMAQKQHIDYRFSAPAQPIRCYTDADKVEKILFNLLSNAFKYTPDGKGIQVSLDRLEEGFTITVRDEGRGIAPEKIEKIFNRFETLGTPKNSLSTGIGLSLVQELVQLLHGNIQVTSSPENGSTFTVSLPGTSSVYQRDPHAEFILEDVSIPVAEEENSDNISSDEESILIVEDNAELRHFIKYILQDEYNVTTAQNGKEGLDKILSAQPGLVISDIMMPIMDGIELLDTVKRNPDISHTPFILLSAKTSVEDRIKGLEYGADDYITKPFSSSYLKARVRSLLQRRRELKDFYLTRTEEKPEKNDAKQSPDSLTRFDDAFMRQTIQEIENNIQNSNFKIEDLADTQHISRTVFYRKIKSLTGISPIDLIQEIRIRKATEYLEKGELRISEIAYRCGFSSPQYFSRVFKEKTGHSPSEHKGDKN